MTIVVGVACPEGLVMAGDSQSSVQLPTGTRVATEYARKVFSIDDRFVAATYGWATLEGKTISGIAREFDVQTTISGGIDEAAEVLRDYFQTRVQAHIAAGWDPEPPAGIEPLGFIVAGYDANGVGQVKRVWPLGGVIQDTYATNNPGGVWNGEVDVMMRLLRGFDSARIDPSKWAKRNRDALAGVQYLMPFGWFALQDAIDWAMFVVRTTIDTQRFTNGTVSSPGAAPTCGGEIEVATVIWGDAVRWVRRTDLKA